MSDRGFAKKNVKVARHRNGMMGNGFYVVTFKNGKQNMVGIVFDENHSCAVLDIDLLASGIIEFAQNSWRCEHFEKDLRQAIAEYEESRSNSATE